MCQPNETIGAKLRHIFDKHADERKQHEDERLVKIRRRAEKWAKKVIAWLPAYLEKEALSGRDKICIDESFWHDYDCTMIALESIVTWARAQGLQAKICSDGYYMPATGVSYDKYRVEISGWAKSSGK